METMKEICVVLGFFLLLGLLVFRTIKEQRCEARRSKLQAARASGPVERGGPSLDVTVARPSSAVPQRTIL